MTKKQKIEFVNKIYDFFTNARNHGHNGNNWWYPKKNVIAYNVKLHGQSKTIEDVREVMSERQNAHYSDDDLYELMQYEQNDTARFFSDSLDEDYGVKSGYAGRSGGWLEVEYNNELTELEENTSENVDYFYKIAKELEKLEAEISNKIQEAHKKYQNYLNTDEFCLDFVSSLMTDEDIGDRYKEQAKNLLDKLN